MAARQMGRGEPGRAVVVDQNAVGRVLLASLLMKRGFEVVELGSAEAGLAYLRQSATDLVLLDPRLGTMSGIALCQIIRDELGLVDLPVVAYTAMHDVTSVAQMRLAGFNDMLFKPLNIAALDSVLNDVLTWH